MEMIQRRSPVSDGVRAATAQSGEADDAQRTNLRDPERIDERNAAAAAPGTEAAAVSSKLAPRSSRCKGVSHGTMPPSITREWAARLLSFEGTANAIPQPARQALRLYSTLPLSHLNRLGQTAPNQPAPPEGQSTSLRPIPPPEAARAVRRGTQDRQGGNRLGAPTSDDARSFTERITRWYESARCTLSFTGTICGEVRLKTTLDNLRKLLDAGPRTDRADLRRIATERRWTPKRSTATLRPAAKAQKQHTTPVC